MVGSKTLPFLTWFFSWWLNRIVFGCVFISSWSAILVQTLNGLGWLVRRYQTFSTLKVLQPLFNDESPFRLRVWNENYARKSPVSIAEMQPTPMRATVARTTMMIIMDEILRESRLSFFSRGEQSSLQNEWFKRAGRTVLRQWLICVFIPCQMSIIWPGKPLVEEWPNSRLSRDGEREKSKKTTWPLAHGRNMLSSLISPLFFSHPPPHALVSICPGVIRRQRR